MWSNHFECEPACVSISCTHQQNTNKIQVAAFSKMVYAGFIGWGKEFKLESPKVRPQNTCLKTKSVVFYRFVPDFIGWGKAFALESPKVQPIKRQRGNLELLNVHGVFFSRLSPPSIIVHQPAKWKWAFVLDFWKINAMRCQGWFDKATAGPSLKCLTKSARALHTEETSWLVVHGPLL
jgi:hypothetical protein